MQTFNNFLKNNQDWALKIKTENFSFFKQMAEEQKPQSAVDRLHGQAGSGRNYR